MARPSSGRVTITARVNKSSLRTIRQAYVNHGWRPGELFEALLVAHGVPEKEELKNGKT